MSQILPELHRQAPLGLYILQPGQGLFCLCLFKRES